MNSQAFGKSITLIGKSNVFPHRGIVSRSLRNHRSNHKSGVIWLTGLSGAGKSTIAVGAEKELFNKNFSVSVLDGDTLRSGLNADLDFSVRAREENLRRAGEVASLFADAGHIVIATFVSPHNKGRQFVRDIVRDNFYLAHVSANLDDCIERDPKGLYKKALSGGIENFTGVGQSYETPDAADLIINTSDNDIETCRQQLVEFIENNFSP